MTEDNYPEAHELEQIKKWDFKDFTNLLNFIQDIWAYADMGYFKRRWTKDKWSGKPILEVELHTGGWSGNEDIINALLENKHFSMCWYSKWEKGGHYYFEINPFNVGFMTVKEYCLKHKCSKQYVSKIKDRFEWITENGTINLCKPKA